MATETTPMPPVDVGEYGDAEEAAAPQSPGERLGALVRPRHRLLLGLILLLAAFLNLYELQREGFANLYYAAAIRSMLMSWHNFFFVSFDPGGFVTVDKPPLGFWIQAASAKLLGYNGFSILLPEALAGVASVGVLYLLVKRLFDTGASLLAALFLAITPVSVVTNRNNTIDSLLVLTVLLAAYAASRAAESGRLRWLLPAALLVTAFAQAAILSDYSGWNSWMTPLIVGGSLVMAGTLVALRLASVHGMEPGQFTAHMARLAYAPVVATTLGVGLLLVGPATWTGVSLASGGGGTLPAAGPMATTAQVSAFAGGRPAFTGSVPPGGLGSFGPPPGGFSGTGTAPTGASGITETLQVNSALVSYLEAHQGSAKYLFATMSSATAAPYIIDTGKAVMALGGFSGSDQILSVSQLQALVRAGQVHYFLLSGGAGGPSGTSGNAALAQWVAAHGTTITVGGVTLYYVSSAAAG